MELKESRIKLHHGNGLLWLCLFLAWLAIFHESVSSAVQIWMASKTYNHCFFVLPIAGYFIYQKRAELACVDLSPNVYVLIPLVMGVCLWALGQAGNVALFSHAGAFSLLPLSIWLVCGNRVAQLLWFPLLYMLFLIPVGEELVPWLQQITADISVYLLRVFGIPVFRDGLYISIPEGRFEVAEACSGIRFFISTLMLASVFAYVSYRSLVRRALFLLVALILPVLANGVRAFGTIMVGHYFGMEYAAGADHLVYGWVFFAFVIAMLFLLGNIWRQDFETKDDSRGGEGEVAKSWQMSPKPSVIAIAAAPLALALVLQSSMNSASQSATTLNVKAFAGTNFIETALSEWHPLFPNAVDDFQGRLVGSDIEAYIAWYAQNTAGSEMVAWENKVYRINRWSLVNKVTREATVSGQALVYSVLDLRSMNGGKRLVAYYYHLPGMLSSNDKRIKLKQAWDKIIGRSTAGGFVALSIPYFASKDKAQKALQRHIEESAAVFAKAFQFSD